MPTKLREELDRATARYSDEVVAIIRGASLEDILAETRTASTAASAKTASPREPAASTAEESKAHLIVAWLRSHPGSAAREVRKALGLTVNGWTYAARVAVKAGAVRKQGERGGRRGGWRCELPFAHAVGPE